MTMQTQTSDQGSLVHAALGMMAGAAVVLAAMWIRQNPAVLSDIAAGAAPGLSATSATLYSTLAAQAQTMGLPLADDSQAYWFIARAGGFVSYILLWLATGWGIVMSSKVAKGRIDATVIYGLHEYLPLMAVVFAAIHALVLLGDSYINFNLIQLFIPFSSTYEPLWTGIGTIALLLSLTLIASTYGKKFIGRKLWRAIHTGAYLAFVLALIHGLMVGTDSSLLGVKMMYALTGGSILFLTYYRLFTYQPKGRRAIRQKA